MLPFANLSADKENEYFSDGLAEDIIDALTQVPGLRVMARTSAFAFRGKEQDVREIGARLNVEHILEGSVRRAGNRIRVTAQLVKASDGYHLWSQRFDREMTDVFAIQDEISQAIVEKLRVRLAGDRPLVKRHTENVEAYHLFLRGRHCLLRMTQESLTKGRKYLEQAIALDPRLRAGLHRDGGVLLGAPSGASWIRKRLCPGSNRRRWRPSGGMTRWPKPTACWESSWASATSIGRSRARIPARPGAEPGVVRTVRHNMDSNFSGRWGGWTKPCRNSSGRWSWIRSLRCTTPFWHLSYARGQYDLAITQYQRR